MELYRTLTGQSQKSYYGSDKPATDNNMAAETTSSTPRPTLTRTLTTTDPLTGTLNHLSEGQEKKLEQFKDRLEKDGWWQRTGVNGKPSHDDGTLLRYLRARKFDIEGAVGQFSETEKWMKENRIEELYEHYDVEMYEKARQMYPMWTGRRDKRGIPIYVYNVKPLNSKAVDTYQREAQKYMNSLPNHKNLQTPSKMLPLFALYHNLLNFVLPLCSTLERPNPEIPVTNSTNIVDITNVGLSQFWNLKSHMQDASVTATAHYPETLDRIFIIGAPSFFPTVWGWIKRWFDPVTVSKIFILSKSEIEPTLSSFMDMKDVPKKYGGQLDWDWGDLPKPDEDALQALEKDGHKGWIGGPCLYLERQRIVVGSEKGKLRRTDEEIAQLKPVVYAADYTEEPVHPERRSSSVHSRASTQIDKHEAAEKKVNKLTPIQTANDPPPVSSPENARVAPMDGAVLNLPNGQPAAPAQTAEYVQTQQAPSQAAQAPAAPAPAEPERGREVPEGVHPTTTPVANSAPQAQAPPHTPQKAAEPVSNSPLFAHHATTVAPPPHSDANSVTSEHKDKEKHHHKHSISGLFHHKRNSKDISREDQKSTKFPSPAPVARPTGTDSEYLKSVHQSIANNMQGESISVIPGSTANGSAAPDMVIASDRSKGLAVDASKIQRIVTANDGENVQRFVTAVEDPVARAH